MAGPRGSEVGLNENTSTTQQTFLTCFDRIRSHSLRERSNRSLRGDSFMLKFVPPTQVHCLVPCVSDPDPVLVVFFGCLHRLEVHVAFAFVPQLC